ncbi:hypothetical protein [Phormidium sp. CCY1219]|uniref:hypothetical protein n=1 Tax=Phormidium sp. CCY1219 TaxID=2886104 RepID=UPI002D1F4563|nr:hypothetical protein [Phormidium sp. CCY1219]MEB3828300.1 hypothetical protein [Phormidium sp. CCY1219]
MSTIPEEYPYDRQWCLSSVDISRYMTIEYNWEASKSLIADIREAIAQAEIHPRVETIAAAGSLGRMEASREVSDADLIIVLSNETDLSLPDAEKAYNSVWRVLERLKINKPKPTGVFAKPTNQQQLLDSVGDANESYDVFGKRLLLMLETQPIYRNENYSKLLNIIVDRYAKQYVQVDSKKEWTFLLNDLIRYFRSLAVNYQWSFDKEVEKWPLRNIKLRHSRLIMYSGLLMLLGEASKERQDKVDWLKQRLKMTPLERIAWVYEQNREWNFHRIAGAYDVFLYNLNKQEFRDNLNVDPANQDDANTYRERYKLPEFAFLKANSDGLIAELLRFILARRGSWSERFFEYLIF